MAPPSQWELDPLASGGLLDPCALPRSGVQPEARSSVEQDQRTTTQLPAADPPMVQDLVVWGSPFGRQGEKGRPLAAQDALLGTTRRNAK